MPISDLPALHPLPGDGNLRAPLSDITPPAPTPAPAPLENARGVKTSEFWVSLVAIILPLIDSHFNLSGSGSSPFSAAIIAAAYTAARTYAKSSSATSP